MSKKIIKRFNLETLEVELIEVEESDEVGEDLSETKFKSSIKTDDADISSFDDTIIATMQSALGCSVDEFCNAYKKYKEAEKEFNDLYIPFKTKLLKIYEDHADQPIPTRNVIGGLTMTYIAPSTRTVIDSKKLKEEEPELVKKYSKTTRVSPTFRLTDI